MKTLKVTFRFVILSVLILILTSGRNKVAIKTDVYNKRSGTAIIMTGAAARLPQETALLEQLYDDGLLKDVVFISGVSAGALNSVALNAILTGRMTWDEYKEVLFNLKNSDIFIQEGKKLPVNTEPSRKFLTDMVEGKLGYRTIGDLPYMTSISFTHLKKIDLKKKVYRMCSRKINAETDTTLSLVDILMASCSMPIAFPPVRIKNVKTIPDKKYIDGGVGDDYLPYQALLDFEKFRGEGVEKIYFISRKTDSIPDISEELKILGIDDKGRFDKLGFSLDHKMQKGFIKRLKAFASEAPELVSRSFVWIPDFQTDFLMFNFSNLKEQYELTEKWAQTHEPTPLAEYLLPYLLKK